MGGSYYPIPCSILSTEKDHKTPQRYPDVPTTSWRISIRSMNMFQGTSLQMFPHHGIDLLAPSTKFFYDHVNPIHKMNPLTNRRGGKLRDLKPEESFPGEILEDLGLL
ncbi:hypothetical protein Tco_0867604 [Tanacetum coccineum]